jgi:hypothetical protein
MGFGFVRIDAAEVNDDGLLFVAFWYAKVDGDNFLSVRDLQLLQGRIKVETRLYKKLEAFPEGFLFSRGMRDRITAKCVVGMGHQIGCTRFLTASSQFMLCSFVLVGPRYSGPFGSPMVRIFIIQPLQDGFYVLTSRAAKHSLFARALPNHSLDLFKALYSAHPAIPLD